MAELSIKPLARPLSRVPREKIAAATRAFVLLTVAVMAHFQTPPPADTLIWIFLPGAIYVVTTALIPPARLANDQAAMLLSIWDVGFITALIYATGGVRSEYYVLYYLPILSAAVRSDIRDAIGASVFAAASYLFAIALCVTDGGSAPNILPRAITFGSSSMLLAGLFAYLAHQARAHQKLADMYKQANDQKTEFVSVAAHELRTPLTSIMGFSDLLGYTNCDPSRQQEFLKIIKGQAERLARLVENILEMSRIDAGRIKIEPTPVKLSDVVAHTVKNIRGASELVKISVPANLPAARADAGRVEQILTTLVENAISYCPEGVTEIEATTEVVGKMPYLRIEVIDNGPGVPAVDLPHIFEIFYCASNSAGRQGTALSLAIAKRMAELQGGEIWVKSPPGEGAAFGLRLPVWVEQIEELRAKPLELVAN